MDRGLVLAEWCVCSVLWLWLCLKLLTPESFLLSFPLLFLRAQNFFKLVSISDSHAPTKCIPDRCTIHKSISLVFQHAL
jgi:hypothetical protein